jgi:hypothetical protein
VYLFASMSVPEIIYYSVLATCRREAWQRIHEDPFTDWCEFETGGAGSDSGPVDAQPHPVWTETSVEPSHFRYNSKPQRRDAVPRRFNSVGEIRLEWGNTQEPVSILAAVNYFAATGGRVEEAGLLPLEATAYVRPKTACSTLLFPLYVCVRGCTRFQRTKFGVHLY